jgi:hypothetical protein
MNRVFPGFVAFSGCLAARFEAAAVKLRPFGQPDYRCRSVTIRMEIDNGGNESFGSHRVGVFPTSGSMSRISCSVGRFWVIPEDNVRRRPEEFPVRCWQRGQSAMNRRAFTRPVSKGCSDHLRG